LGGAQIDPLADQAKRLGPGEKHAREGFALRRHQPASRSSSRSKGSRRPKGKTGGRVGGALRQRATTRPIAASSPASMWRTISGGSNGVPWINKCCANCSQRAEVL